MTSTIWTQSLPSEVPPEFHKWMIYPYILFDTLEKIYPEIELMLFNTGISITTDCEAKILNLSEKMAYVREVGFKDMDNHFLTLGRVVVPLATYTHFQGLFDELKDQPIGNTLLYNKPDVMRGGFEFSLIDRGSYKHIGQYEIKSPLPARRSIFWIKGHPLLVIELYCPHPIFEKAV